MSMTTFVTLKLLFTLLMVISLLRHCQAERHDNSTPKEIALKNDQSTVSLHPQQMAKNTKETISTGLIWRKRRQALTVSPPPPSAAAIVATATAFDLESFSHQLSLPSVPIPPPPPFPANFNGLSPFTSSSSSSSTATLSSGSSGLDTKPLNAFAFKPQTHSSSPSSTLAQHNCGGVLRARHGIVQTPNFPHKFQTPIECVWVIDASELIAHPGHNISIVVYLTQLYALGGLKFTEYMYYSDDYKVPAHRVFTLTEDDVTQVAWVQFNSQYLEIRFHMSTLDGTHLRALDRLLDVYGFNMTYEVEPVKAYQCNTLQCRFLGHCYAKWDFSSYYCSCFAGFAGQDCGRGPLCEDPHTNICQNGGTCKHIGDAAITCHCPAGFKGTKCEIPDINAVTMGCTANSSALSCHQECNFESSKESGLSLLKTSRTSGRSGKTRYEVTIRLGANLTAFYRNSDHEQQHKSKEQMPATLERHLSRVLRNFNITKISDLELISNSTDRLDITFHFFGVKGDSDRIREAITRMVERGRIGNITLVSNYHLFDENPPLNLMDLAVNQKQIIREDSQFILSCTALGSARMQFQWYKDGVIVNASKATRDIWTTVLPPESKDVFTAILGISKANRLDEGIYTCRVIDWGVEQCRSMHVHIKSPPRLRVDPASVTLHRGDSLRVRCLSPGNDDIKRYAQLGYSWTRNGNLFQSDPKTVMWEDLYPDGSILKINNIQKSAEYACVVSNTVKPVSKSVYITVIDRSAVHVCRAETAYGVHWPTSAPGGVPVISDCPRGFEGYSRRTCEKRDAGNTTWLTPDFSNCIRDQLLRIYNKFRALTSGFQQTNTSELLKASLDYTLKRYKHFLPGEAGFLIDMLHELDNYLQLKGTQLEREMAAEIILHILDKVMQNPQSLNSQQQIKKLQLLTQSAALNRETIAASQLATSTSTGSITQNQAAASSSSSSSGTSSLSSVSATSHAMSGSSSPSSSSSASILSSSVANRIEDASSSSTLHGSSTTNMGDASHAVGAGVGATGSNRQTLLKTDISQSGANGAGGPLDATHMAGAGIGSGSGSHSVLTVDEDSLSLDRLNSLRIYMTSIKTLPFNLRIYGDDLFSDQLYMDIGISNRLLNIMTNNTIFASVISYKNLKSFLPKTYYTRGSDPKESDYILASRIIQTWLFQSNRSNDNLREPLDLSFEQGHVEIIFQHERAPKDGDWTAVCGHDYKASFESSWRSDLCITKNLMENITRCICPVSGTYVVMLTKRNNHSHHYASPPRPLFVIVSCVCCLLQSCSAFIILLPIWFNRQCAITFLKMQFCVSTSSIMVIFLLGFLKMLPVNWQPVISSSLASLLLLGISTLIAIALVIHSELVPKKVMHLNVKSTNATNSTASTAVTANSGITTANTNISTTINTGTATSNMGVSVATPTNATPSKMGTLTKPHHQQQQQQQQQQKHELDLEKSSKVGSAQSTPDGGGAAGTNISITQISGTTTPNEQSPQTLRRSASALLKPPTRFKAGKALATSASSSSSAATAASGVRAAIGISWLLPLLFAITSPLICTINGKWPQNWWLEIMSHSTTLTMATMAAGTAGAGPVVTGGTAGIAGSSTISTTTTITDSSGPLNGNYLLGTHLTHHYSTQQHSVAPPLLSNGDSVLEFNATTLSDTMGAATMATTSTTAGIVWSSHTPSPRAAINSMSSSLLHNDEDNYVGAAAGGSSNGGGGSLADGLLSSSYPGAMGAVGPSLSFILFLCVDILFILLFFALFAILIKKLLWLWHKNRRSQQATMAMPHHQQQQLQQQHLQHQLQLQQHHPHPHQHQQLHQLQNHTPLDRFNTAMKQRIGLLYRTGCLLLIKLCTDALFIVYSNTTSISLETWWCYPFGISCILMGFTILCCFVIRPESPLRNQGGNMGRYSSSDNLKKKLSSSKTSLDDNYCTGSINAPISFYTSHEKESELSSSAPPLMHKTPPSPPHATRQQLEMSVSATGGGSVAAAAATCQIPGLTIISTAPRCQMMPSTLMATSQQDHHVASVETFIGMQAGNNNCSTASANSVGAGGTSTLERKTGKHSTCLQQQQQQQHHPQHHHHHHLHAHAHHQQAKNLQQTTATSSSSTSATSITSPATRCCNILAAVAGGGAGGIAATAGAGAGNNGINIVGAGNIVQQPQHHSVGMPQVVSGSSMGYYDAYAGSSTGAVGIGPATSMAMTGSLNRRTHMQSVPQQHQYPAEYIGVETLDIMQGVGTDTLIGIRTNTNPVSICPAQGTSYHHQTQPQTGQYTTSNVGGVATYISATPPQMLPPGAPTIVSISGLTNIPPTTAPLTSVMPPYSMPATIITTTSVTTQTPKTQKRVTIMEPTTHTFDPMLPTMVAVMQGTNTTASGGTTTAKTNITNTQTTKEDKKTLKATTSDEECEDAGAMLDRITHDLNYLLNGAEDDQIPPPPRPPTGTIPTMTSHTATTATTNVTGETEVSEIAIPPPPSQVEMIFKKDEL